MCVRVCVSLQSLIFYSKLSAHRMSVGDHITLYLSDIVYIFPSVCVRCVYILLQAFENMAAEYRKFKYSLAARC